MGKQAWRIGWLVLISLLILPAVPTAAQDSAARLAQADGLYAQRADMAKAQQAASVYQEILKAEPNHEEAAWKLCRVLYWVGTHQGGDAQLTSLEASVEAGKKAVAINPKSLPGHFWLGVAYGVYGKAKGIMKSLALLNPIKEEMAFVLNVDESYEDGGPHRVLGRLLHQIPGIVGGSKSEAVKHLAQAVKLGSQRWLNHIYLAQVYIDQDKKTEAKALLQQVIAGPAQPGLEPEYADWSAEAKKLLEGMK